MERSIVRNNLMKDKNYTPYCGSDTCKVSPRTVFKKDEHLGYQFHCPVCDWISLFPKSFIERYIEKWDLD